MPTKEIPPSELFAKLLEMPRPSEVIDFPRNDAHGNPVDRIRVQVLTSLDHDKAREQAHAALKGRGLDKEDMSAPAIREVLGDAIAKELIAMACLTERDFGDAGKPTYGRIFRNAKDVDSLAADEILILFNAYQLVQSKYGPFERNLSADDIEAWITRLGEGGSEFPLLSLALPQLVLLAQCLGERLYTLSRIPASPSESSPSTSGSPAPDSSTDTGSAGSPVDATDLTGSERRDRPLGPITTEAARDMAEKMRDRS